MKDGKSILQCYLDTVAGELVALSHTIHKHPELGFEEFFARDRQVELLRAFGFSVEVPFAGLETAFKASLKTGEGPCVAFMAEYDALPEYGHACGHNIIAATAVGAGIGLAHAMKEAGISGEVIVFGTPGEEGKHGKIYLVDHGAFANVDFALMMHPGSKNLIGRGALAVQRLRVRYHGKPAHSAVPEKGINALTSMISLFTSIDQLRQTWPDSGRCNGIITKGGKAHNIIPDLAEAEFCVRASKKIELVAMMKAIRAVAEAAASITGAKLEFLEETIVAERHSNMTMCEMFKANMESMGEKMNYPDPGQRYGSSDVGNVSLEVPTIHDYLAITGPEIIGHTHEFREASISSRADDVVLLGAKGLGMTGWDLMTNAAKREEACREFAEKVAPFRC